MPDPLPRLILTGASGIVGRGFLQAARDRFRIYAIARRPQQKASVPLHPKTHWLQADIGHQEALAGPIQLSAFEPAVRAWLSGGSWEKP